LSISVVLGGAGFLGSHLVDALVSRGESVVVFDDLANGRLANLEPSISSGRVTFIYVDAAEPITIPELLQSNGMFTVERIYYCASTPVAEAHGSSFWNLGFPRGSTSLVDFAVDKHIRFVFVSAPDTYCGSSGALSHESAEAKQTEVRADVGDAVRFGEAVIAAAIDKRSLDGRIVRLFDCFGPRMASVDGSFVSALLEATASRRPLAINGSGEQKRSLTFVSDAVKMLLEIADRDGRTTEPFNIRNEEERTLSDIVKTCTAMEAGRPRTWFRENLRPATTRSATDGCTAATPLETGLRLTYAWYSRESRLFV
jgi:nucleoside-diphosphate-sugar epimerase